MRAHPARAWAAAPLEEIIGRNDLLERVERPEVPRAQMLDLSLLLAPADAPRGRPPCSAPRQRNDRPGLVSLDEEILAELAALPRERPAVLGQLPDPQPSPGGGRAGGRRDRASGSGDAGLPPGRCGFGSPGAAGQSFGAFASRGMHLELEGEANDYVGKGLSGGEITIRPFRRAAYADASHQHLVLGNTVLYGATAGRLFAAGQAGDRFAVRNSGAIAVIEGAGNHCCEYMTGGHRGGAGPRGPELRRRDVERRGLRAR